MSTREILIRYDDVGWFPMPSAMEAALVDFMRSFCAEMRELDDPEVWTWGRCYVGDLSRANPRFEYGGDADFPDDELGDFAVVREL